MADLAKDLYELLDDNLLVALGSFAVDETTGAPVNAENLKRWVFSARTLSKIAGWLDCVYFVDKFEGGDDEDEESDGKELHGLPLEWWCQYRKTITKLIVILLTKLAFTSTPPLPSVVYIHKLLVKYQKSGEFSRIEKQLAKEIKQDSKFYSIFTADVAVDVAPAALSAEEEGKKE